MGSEREQNLGSALENLQSDFITKIRKTPKMLAIEAVVRRDIRSFLRKTYSREGATINDIAQEILNLSGGEVRVSAVTARGWLEKLGIPRKPGGWYSYWHHPVYGEQRIIAQTKAMIRLWQDPETRAKMITAGHSPQAEKKRRKSFETNHWSKNPEIRKKVMEKKLATMLRKKLEKMKKVLGENPEEELRRLYWRRGLSLSEIGEKCGCSLDTIRRWMGMFEIERKRQGRYSNEGFPRAQNGA